MLILFNVCTAAIYTDKPQAGHRRGGTRYISYSSHGLSQCFSVSLQEHKIKYTSSINVLPGMFIMGISSCKALYFLHYVDATWTSIQEKNLSLPYKRTTTWTRAKNKYSVRLLIVWCNRKIHTSTLTSRGPNKVLNTQLDRTLEHLSSRGWSVPPPVHICLAESAQLFSIQRCSCSGAVGAEKNGKIKSLIPGSNHWCCWLVSHP